MRNLRLVSGFVTWAPSLCWHGSPFRPVHGRSLASPSAVFHWLRFLFFFLIILYAVFGVCVASWVEDPMCINHILLPRVKNTLE